LQFPYPLLPLPSNEFHRSMEYFHGYVEWFPQVHGITAMGPWNDFHGYMELFPSVYGNISVGWRVLLYSIKYNWFTHVFHGVVDRVSER
jgi:hypothetical protein